MQTLSDRHGDLLGGLLESETKEVVTAIHIPGLVDRKVYNRTVTQLVKKTNQPKKPKNTKKKLKDLQIYLEKN